MSQKVFSFVSGILFIFGAFVHLARILQGWDAMIAGIMIPHWVSWVAVVICGVLGFYGLKYGTRP